MEKYMIKYNEWMNNPNIDNITKEELEKIKNDDNEIKERFYKELEFGTAGLRGKLGAGTNRMNSYIISKATKAFANVIKSKGTDYMEKGIAIAYDSRLFSKEFAEQVALIMASSGIKAYLFDSLRPTPELSFAILYYGCAAGINITASHNPKEYNGYKVYWKEGSQIKSDIADKILDEMKNIDIFSKTINLTKEEAIEKGLIVIIGEEVDNAFYKEVLNSSLRDDTVDKNIKIVYTPLNGAGNIPVRKVLDMKGYKNVYVVSEQEKPDGTFPTLEYPNPEDLKAFAYSEKLAKEVDADILIATDPDCDRLAAEVLHKGEIVALNGNQLGVLLINYIVSTMHEKNILPKNPVIVKSIVTGEMGIPISEKYGVTVIDVLTGFKNICAIANMYEKTKEKNYIFGYEESIGYNVGTFVRDKDGVTSALLVAEMAAYYKKNGLTLIDVLEDLYKEFGYYKEKGISIVLEGIEGQERIKRMMEEFRNIYPKEISGVKISEITDYLKEEKTIVETNEKVKIDIEKTDAIKFLYEDSSWYTLRPSGTEPKIKLYVYVKDENNEKANEKIEEFSKKVLEIIHSIK